MDENKLGKIEKALLTQELMTIREKLQKLAIELEDVFRPYHERTCNPEGIDSDFADAMSEFIKKTMFARRNYCAGYVTIATICEQIPDRLKDAILKKVTAASIERVGTIEEIASAIAFYEEVTGQV